MDFAIRTSTFLEAFYEGNERNRTKFAERFNILIRVGRKVQNTQSDNKKRLNLFLIWLCSGIRL